MDHLPVKHGGKRETAQVHGWANFAIYYPFDTPPDSVTMGYQEDRHE